jgi:hypothetical protein
MDYLNFPSPLTLSHDSEDAVPSSIFKRKAWTTIEDGFGSRHVEDTAPFSLWDQKTKDFRSPTKVETGWIFDRYSARGITILWPILIIETEHPPSPLPLTVACVAALFVPPPDPPEGENRFPSAYGPSFLQVNTSFASPRVPDPISHYKLEPWKIPSRQQQEHVLEVLSPMMNIKRLNFTWPYIIVELHTDDRAYGRYSLPGRVAGCTTLYHQSELSYWQDIKNQPRARFIDPQSGIHDTTNYLSESSSGSLSPGVGVSAGPSTDQDQADISRSTTAGVLLRNPDGRVRLTVANQGFIESDEVFHPTTHGLRIGEISERRPAQDIALVNLYPSISFQNHHYFEAQPPRRLFRSDELEHSKTGTWFSVDGISTGLLFLFLRGISLYEGRRPSSDPSTVAIDRVKWSREHIFQVISPTGGNVSDGVRGAPIVEENPEMGGGGGVAGFFKSVDNEICLSPVLDELVDEGWTLQ